MSLMSISQSTGSAATTATDPLDGVVATVLQDDGVTSTTSTSDSSSVSGPGAMMKELTDLAKSDPTKFKQVTADVAKKLKEEAASTTDPGQAKRLEQMADSFEKASESGDASDLRPPKPPGGGRDGASQYQSAAQFTSSDSQASLQATLLSALSSSSTSSSSST